jgi:2'-5' RNA ligase
MEHDASRTARLFLAAVPNADTAGRIYRLAGALKRAHKFEGKIIEQHRLHISLFFFGGSPNPIARLAREAAAEVRAPPFEVLFDRSSAFEAGPAIARSYFSGTRDWTG